MTWHPRHIYMELSLHSVIDLSICLIRPTSVATPITNMASSTAVGKSQPPKARKRIGVGLPSAPPGNKQLQVAGAFASDGGICCEDTVITDVHEYGEESTKASPMFSAKVIRAKDAAREKTDASETESKITRKRRTRIDAIEVSPKPVRAKKEKDPNQPKRPPTAFFLFMEDFRQTYKKANPNAKGGSAQISKAGSETWRSMSDEAKEQYAKKCAGMKEEYQKALKIYNSAGKDSIESTITDNAEGKCDGADDQSCEETAASQPPVML
ncbi:hypothetical protein GOP47_0027547 [Adiantum capillus-veneris]|nr:hypothetical protein GOP47_0027547 [Adiantum capillus-veneris]